MALTLFHVTNYQGLIEQLKKLIAFEMKIIEDIKETKIGYEEDGIVREAKNLERILYDHFYLYAHVVKLRNVESLWTNHTKIYAYITGEQTQSIYWEILIDDPNDNRSLAIQIPSTETSAHLPISALILVVNKLVEKKFLKAYTHINAAKTFNYP